MVTRFIRGVVTLQTWDESQDSLNRVAGYSDKRRSGIRSITFRPSDVDKKQVTFEDFDYILANPTSKTRRSLSKLGKLRGNLRF